MPNQCIKRLSFAGIAITSTLLVSACAGNGEGGGSESKDTIESMSPISYTVALSNTESSAGGRAIVAAFDEITEKTGGKISFEYYWSGSLVPPTEFLTATGTGVADIAYLSTSIHPKELPISNWVLNLGGASSTAFPHGFLSGAAAMNTAFVDNEDIQKEFASNKVRALALYNIPRADLLCTSPINDLASARGKTTRVTGEAWIADAQSLGMNTSFMPQNEVYEALQRKVVDCITNMAPVYRDAGLWEVAKHYVPASFSSFPGSSYVMNLDKWHALPREVQTIFDEAMNTLITEWIKNDLAGYADFAKRGVAEHNVVFEDSTEVDAVLARRQADVMDGLASTAPAGLSNPDGFIQKYLDDLDKWVAVLTEDAGIPVQTKDSDSVYDSYVKEYDLQPYFDALNESLSNR